MLWSLALFGFVFASAQGRAVNISNTWVLPEEGFPVFYRYFRDRISWYEADAVCQFHHANLVTVDTTAQYDAVRAYLKELDISSAVWVGLIRSNPDGDFTWTDYRGLSGDGYWSSAPDPRAAPLCAAADPAADYRWEARACGGPTVASFICELPVPQWALGNEGCMVRELPALTVLYLPESAAVQLTADCGLAGVKKVQCTGNLKRESLLRDLSCTDEDEQSSTPNTGATTSISSSMASSENPLTDQDTINDVTTEDNITTEHEDDINQSTTVRPTDNPYYIRPSLSEQAAKQIISNVNKILISKNINLDDNMQSNDIPKLVGNDNYLSSDLSEKFEDESHKQHKILHDEIARHGSFETIFTQPTDHFVPPLVMAKAKISDDMTVLSLEEKHAQQLAEMHYAKHPNDNRPAADKEILATTLSPTTKDNVNENQDADKPLITSIYPATLTPELKKDVLKNIVPKKYNNKYYGLKSKSIKFMENKSIKNEKPVETLLTSSQTHLKEIEITTPKYFIEDTYKTENEPTIDLTVVIKEPSANKHENNSLGTASDIPKIMIIQNDTSITKPEFKLGTPESKNGEVTQEISVKLPSSSNNNFTLSHEVIKITILKEENSSDVPTVIEVTTKMPVFDERNLETTVAPSIHYIPYETTNNTNTLNYTATTHLSPVQNENLTESTSYKATILTTLQSATTQKEMYDTTTTETHTDQTSTTLPSLFTTTESNDNMTNMVEKSNSNSTQLPEILSTETDLHDDEENAEMNTTDTSETIDDFQSPLLSGANEPVHRPNRSRRPQPANRINKFNPFRILG